MKFILICICLFLSFFKCKEVTLSSEGSKNNNNKIALLKQSKQNKTKNKRKQNEPRSLPQDHLTRGTLKRYIYFFIVIQLHTYQRGQCVVASLGQNIKQCSYFNVQINIPFVCLASTWMRFVGQYLGVMSLRKRGKFSFLRRHLLVIVSSFCGLLVPAFVCCSPLLCLLLSARFRNGSC